MFGNSKVINQQGFLLGEALIALSVLAFGLVAVTESIAAAQRAQGRGRQATKRAICAEERLIATVSGPDLGQENCAGFNEDDKRQWEDIVETISPAQ